MGLDELLDVLDNYLKKGRKNKTLRLDRLDDILDLLKEKKARLKRKLDEEKSAKQKKRIKTELKIISLQLKKGLARRDELADADKNR